MDLSTPGHDRGIDKVYTFVATVEVEYLCVIDRSGYTLDTKDQFTQESTTRNGGATNNFAYDTAGNPTSLTEVIICTECLPTCPCSPSSASRVH